MPRIRKTLDTLSEIIKKWKVAIYIRLSKDDGNDESYSVKNQRERLNDYFNDLAANEDVEFIDYYIDDGFTGVDSDRDDFQRLLTDVQKKKVNCIIVKDLSRLSRNDWECKYYLQLLFVELNVRFISLELPKLDSFKRPEEIYDIGVSFQSMYNENHCRETSIKVRGTLNKKREKGQFIGAFAPYGYLKDPQDRHHFIINPETAPVVKDIFQWFVYEGMSKQAIAKRLVASGLPSPALYKQQKGMNYHNPNATDGKGLWSHRTVDQILHNESYLGHMVQGRHKVKSYKVHTIVAIPREDWYVVENTHEPIIDQATFDLAQTILQRDTRVAPNKKQVYTFSGFLKCADCGRGMTRRKCRGYVYYACKTYVHYSHDLCTRHSLKNEDLEKTVLLLIQKQIALVETLAQAIEEINKAPVIRTTSNRVNAQLKLRTQELEKTIRLKDGLYLDWKSGDISRDDYHRMKQAFEEKEQTLRQAISELQEEAEDMSKGIHSDDPYLTTFLKHKNIQSLNRGIIVDLIKCIYVHEGGDITVEFNYADQHRRIVEFIENNHNDLTIISNSKAI